MECTKVNTVLYIQPVFGLKLTSSCIISFCQGLKIILTRSTYNVNQCNVQLKKEHCQLEDFSFYRFKSITDDKLMN